MSAADRAPRLLSAILLASAGFGVVGESLGQQARVARHSFGHRHAHIHWGAEEPRDATKRQVTIMHISDAHIALNDEFAPLSSRMFSAFVQTTDKVSRQYTSPQNEFRQLLQKACNMKVDLIALGGDILNFPSEETVSWLSDSLRTDGCGIPYVFTSGNHDWHVEGLPTDGAYDAQRLPQMSATLRPLYEASAASGSPLVGLVELNGVEVLTVDNSNYQVTQEQLDFVKNRLSQEGGPVVMLVHVPFALEGINLAVNEVCGHSDWGTHSDHEYTTESRPPWPAGNLPTTGAFLELIKKESAPSGRLMAILSGHVHRDFSTELEDKVLASNFTALTCNHRLPGCSMRQSPAMLRRSPGDDTSSFLHIHDRRSLANGAKVFQVGSALGGQEDLLEAQGAVQYTTLDAAEGGYRLLTVHLPERA